MSLQQAVDELGRGRGACVEAGVEVYVVAKEGQSDSCGELGFQRGLSFEQGVHRRAQGQGQLVGGVFLLGEGGQD